MKIYTLNDINLSTNEGRLLFMAIARLTSLVDIEKTPNEVLELLIKLDEELRRS